MQKKCCGQALLRLAAACLGLRIICGLKSQSSMFILEGA